MRDLDPTPPGSACKFQGRENKSGPCNQPCGNNHKPLPRPTPQALPPGTPVLEHDEQSLLVTGFTVVASMLSSALLLCIFFALVRLYFNKRTNHSRRRSLPVVFFGTQDDFFLDEDQIPQVDNPIWYINTVGLQQSVIDSITVFKYKKHDGLIEGTECSVCLNEFQENESLRLLHKCSHGFHLPCIDTWLRSHQNCPLCRAPVVSETMIAQTSEPWPNSIDSGSSNETLVENDVGEGGTSQEMRTCRIEDEDNWENSRKILGHSDSNILTDIDGIQEEIHATRRSVSLDLSSAMEIAGEATAKHKHRGSLDTELQQLKCSTGKIAVKRSRGGSSIYKLMKSSSIGRSLTKGPVSMKRSFSSGGIFLLSKRTKGQSSILPL
ncbi:hypothetical protein ES319_D12G085200v1 [Gossypium barbadense]|uniref:RING-type E3 ubiquitin transferase n=3 Tax=Gossypium TaxID=3633 RepID=A0A5J5NVU3_GOSBA|nr:hypothetical protein ES319_D12G085100v1 [Gossypium barbadense]KAB1998389.1 hypothetical protein ES319_D12G085200v1 [Gossypium barbadense]PPD96073.1 hypothetical protein GOBAR_DD06898 [Gossypium barbadense]